MRAFFIVCAFVVAAPVLAADHPAEFPRLSREQLRIDVRPLRRGTTADRSCLINMACICPGYKRPGELFACSTVESCESDPAYSGKSCSYDIYDPSRCYTYENDGCDCIERWGRDC